MVRDSMADEQESMVKADVERVPWSEGKQVFLSSLHTHPGQYNSYLTKILHNTFWNDTDLYCGGEKGSLILRAGTENAPLLFDQRLCNGKQKEKVWCKQLQWKSSRRK